MRQDRVRTGPARLSIGVLAAIAAATLTGHTHLRTTPSAPATSTSTTTSTEVAPIDPSATSPRPARGAWSIVQPAPVSGKLSQLNGVSCVSVTFCVAVGSSAPSLSAVQPDALYEMWDGNGWSAMRSNRSARKGALSGVSCTSTKFCVGVGALTSGATTSSSPLLVSWNGTTWSAMTAPTGAASSSAGGVSCVSVRFCMAVGAEVTGSGPKNVAEKPLILSWNGKQWTAVPAPRVGRNLDILSGVSCTTPRTCVGVGADGTIGSKRFKVAALTEAFNGSRWSVVPNPAASQNPSLLYGLSCAASDRCTAVGQGAAGMLTESWNGKSWSILGSRALLGDQLVGIACTKSAGSSQCTAVGDSGPIGILQHFAPDGSAPSASAPFPNCLTASASECGVSDAPSVQKDKTVVARSVAGAPWTIEPSQNVAGSDSILGGVACVAAKSGQRCAAVGIHARISTTKTPSISVLIEMNF